MHPERIRNTDKTTLPLDAVRYAPRMADVARFERARPSPSISCFVINMDRDQARWAHMRMERVKAGMALERFSAISGADLPTDMRVYFEGVSDSVLSPGEIGCYASHLAICRKIVAGEVQAPVLVLEDDVALIDNFAEVLRELINKLPAGWDIVRLSNPAKRAAMPIAKIASAYDLVRYSEIPGSTGAILWSKAGAEKFLRLQTREQPIDQDLKRPHWGLETYGVLPMPLKRDIFNVSTIDSMTAQGWRSKKERRTRLSVIRAADRGARFIQGWRAFGAVRWLCTLAINAITPRLPKRKRASFLRVANRLLARA